MVKALNASFKKDEGIDDITWHLNGAMNPDSSFTVIKTVLELRKIIFGAAVTTSQMPDKQGY